MYHCYYLDECPLSVATFNMRNNAITVIDPKIAPLDKEFNIVFRMTLSEFREAAAKIDAGTMEHFYSSIR